MTTARKHRVLFLVHRKELCSQITSTFQAGGVDFKLCSVMMVQTACRRLHKMPQPDVIIIDEAHHVLSGSYRKILQYYPAAYVLGFTATPVRMNEGGLGAVFEELIESVSTEWLIQNGYLAPYKYYGVQLADTSKLHTKHGDFDKAEVEQLMNQSAIFGSAVDNWQKLATGKKTIVYCSSIETSKNTVEAFKAAGVSAAHLDGTTPKLEREQTVAAFRSGTIKVLSNVDLFGEGFDVPDCEAVVLLRPTKSLTLHVQQSMRSMRRNPSDPDKVAIILDHVGNFARHGLPDDEREWTLQAKESKKQEKRLIKQCNNCFTVCRASAKVCPTCGMEFATEDRAERQVVEDVELQEISKLPYSDYTKCKDWNSLELFRKAHGYKFMWSLHKAKERGILVPNKFRWMCLRMGVQGVKFG